MSTSSLARFALMALSLAICGCDLGDEGAMVSPYESAYFEEGEHEGVADGSTAVTVRVRGEAGTTLTLLLQSGEFAGGAGEAPNREKTVQLTEVASSKEGLAEVQLVSSQPGIATLSFKVAPLANSLEVAFAPVALQLGSPRAVEIWPGEVAHDVCVYANTTFGTLNLSATVGALVPDTTPLVAIESDSQCAALSGFPGVGQVQWISSDAATDLVVSYTGANGEQILTLSSQLRGELFPGYAVVFSEVEVTESWTRLDVKLDYRETLSVSAAAATSVALRDLRSVPAGLSLVGSSSGGEETVPQTDAEGWVTLYFENQGREAEVSVFATLAGGGTLLLGNLPAPSTAEGG
jgi:hypothetical protein